jgi:hypothetical protein
MPLLDGLSTDQTLRLTPDNPNLDAIAGSGLDPTTALAVLNQQLQARAAFLHKPRQAGPGRRASGGDGMRTAAGSLAERFRRRI